MKSKIIEEFLENYPSKNTKKAYRTHLANYFRILDIDPETYFQKDRDYEADVKRASREIADRPPMSQKGMMSAIKVFLVEHNVELKERVWRSINRRRNGSHPISIEKIPTNQDLKTILQYADIKGRALFLLSAVTGMRIDEMLNITLDNIDLENRTITLMYNMTKGGRARTTFFTEESKEALEQWLNHRETFLRHGYHKSKYKRGTLEKNKMKVEEAIATEDRVFPFGDSNARDIWVGLLEKAGVPYNEKDTQKALAAPRYKMHIHTIRKFWFTTMKSTDANKDHINTIGGHTSELGKTYEKFSIKALKETYDNYSDMLSIFSDLDKVNDKIDEKLGEQREIVASLQHRNTVLEQQMQLTRDMMRTMALQLETLQQQNNLGGK